MPDVVGQDAGVVLDNPNNAYGVGTSQGPQLDGTTHELVVLPGAVTITGTQTITGAKTFTALTILAGGAQIGSDANSLQLSDTLGTNGRRISIQPPNAATSTASSQLELVPGTLINPAIHCTTQILLYNKSGADYERFTFSCVNNQYMIESTYNGAGAARNIYFQMGGSVSNAITGQNAITIYSDASVDLLGASYTAHGVNWGVTRTRIVDPANTGTTRLTIDTRTGTPAANASDSSTVELRRGNSRKWVIGLNAGGDNLDTFDFFNATGRVLSITQAEGALTWSAVGAATDTNLGRGSAGGRLTLTGATDVRFSINSTSGSAGASAAVEFQRAGAAKWQLGLNFAAGGTSDDLDFYAQSVGAALTLTRARSVVIGQTAPATTATDGFPYIPVCAGTPTGVPTAKAGFVPMVFDSSGVKVWFYTGGSWKGVVVA